jgi:Flp pilus assembly protein TadD
MTCTELRTKEGGRRPMTIRATSETLANQRELHEEKRERELSRGDNDKGRDNDFDRSASAAEFRQGLACHQQGRLPEAERHYNAALRSEPDHFEALHMLGVIAPASSAESKSSERRSV